MALPFFNKSDFALLSFFPLSRRDGRRLAARRPARDPAGVVGVVGPAVHVVRALHPQALGGGREGGRVIKKSAYVLLKMQEIFANSTMYEKIELKIRKRVYVILLNFDVCSVISVI